ncbi:MAG: energy-coupling factor transporter transmembrane protein EcfT [Clostridium sp.]|nr:energy-coupling factor transporter transmembrane protein EcfT [Clostridium sp.]
MTRKNAFSTCHPAVNLLYFVLVLAFSMVLMHPVSLVISLSAALACSVSLNGGCAVRRSLWYLLPMMLMTVVINPAFNHRGATILCYLPTGNPLTLESIFYGAAAASMLAAVVVWFTCYTSVMTSDKFIYLFGRVIPALSLVLSMTLRFVPRFKAQLRVVTEAQRCVGRDVSSGSILQRTKTAVNILSVLVTWALENAIETADSMKSRGYGLPARTAFSIYSLNRRDKVLLGWLTGCGALLLWGVLRGALSWQYYPTAGGRGGGLLPVLLQLCYLTLCLTPVILNGKEDWKWTRLHCGN